MVDNFFFFFSSRRRHTRLQGDWSSDVCSSDLIATYAALHVMASTPNFLYANQSYASFLTDDVIEGGGPLPYHDGSLGIPKGPGVGITLDRDRLARYAELYRKQGAV